MKRLALACAFFGVAACTLVCSAQKTIEPGSPPPLSPAEGDRQGRILMDRLLATRPQANVTNSQVMRIRSKEGKVKEVQVRFELLSSATNYQTIYQTADGSRLTIIHTDNQPNQYLLQEPRATAPFPGQRLAGSQLYQPFSGSDFWIGDLGLEFLHWPNQRVLQKEMRKNLSCNVLESRNPSPPANGYSRVVSWISINQTNEVVLIHADAYDAKNELLKEFDPLAVEKVNGSYQLQEMEMRNRQEKTRTRIEFYLEK